MCLKKGDGIRTFKDTFWSKKRVEANMSIEELATAIGVKPATLGAWLIGCTRPKPDNIRALCDWFGVDYDKGEMEFERAWKTYDPQRFGKKVKTTAKHIVTTPANTVCTVKSEVNMQDNDKLLEIKRLVYGKVPYEVFNAVENAQIDKVAETVYGRVDYTVYKTIENIVSGKVVKVENFDSKWEI